jgi:hypothetical protein
VAEWATLVLKAKQLRSDAEFGRIVPGIVPALSAFMNIGFWRAHNAALREGVERADRLGLRQREPIEERTLINLILYNVLEPGDQCAAGNPAFCTMTVTGALSFGTTHIYPQEYPATKEDIDWIILNFKPIWLTWILSGGRYPSEEVHLVR